MAWKQIESLGNLLKERQRQNARKRLLAYCQAVFPPYQAGRHHQYLIAKLESVEGGECARLAVSEPPQHGKTLTISELFPCWYLGRDPRRRVVVATYGDDRAQDIGRIALRTLRDDSHHREIFPESDVDLNAASATRIDLTAGGSFYAVGRGGALTGRSADLLIIDDLLKDDREARSAAIRREVIEWYTRVAVTRLAPEGVVILVGTRWGRGDLFDYLLTERREENWDVVNLSAIAEANDPLGRLEGEALWPTRYDVDVLRQKRAEVGSAAWTCLYQGQPTAAEGQILRREWWSFYSVAPERFERRIISVDSAFKTGQSNDYSAIQVWGKTETGYYLLSNWRARVEFPELKKRLVQFAEEWRSHCVVVEDAASGQSLLQELRSSTALPLKPFKPDRDKESRAQAITPLLECGRVFLPQSAPWLDEFLDEVSAFPRGAHDDMVDALTMALNWFQERGSYAGGWLVAQARQFAAQKQLGPKTAAELSDSQKKLYERQSGRNFMNPSGMVASGGYPKKDLETELRRQAAQLKRYDACPKCANRVLARAGDYVRCNCGWDAKLTTEPARAARSQAGRAVADQPVSAADGGRSKVNADSEYRPSFRS